MAVIKLAEGQPGDVLGEFPLNFWYHHRMMGNVLRRYGFTLEALTALEYGDYRESLAREPVVTHSVQGIARMSGNRTWTGTAENLWHHWIELIDDIPNVGPKRLLELVNYLRSAGAELPWFADFDQLTQNWAALDGCHREPPATVTS
jgi:hypothetical protein